MAEKKLYPPTYLTPGDITRLTASDGVIEFIAVYQPSTLKFFTAFLKWRNLTTAPMQASTASLEAAMREVEQTWGRLDNYTMKMIMEKMEPGQIWTPEKGGGDNG